MSSFLSPSLRPSEVVAGTFPHPAKPRLPAGSVGSRFSLPGSGNARLAPCCLRELGPYPPSGPCPDPSGSFSLHPPVFLSSPPLTAVLAASWDYLPLVQGVHSVSWSCVHTSQVRDLQMVIMFFPLVSRSSDTLAGTWGADLAHPGMAWDTQGCLPESFFTAPACPFSYGNLGRGGDGAQGADFVQQLPLKKKKKSG